MIKKTSIWICSLLMMPLLFSAPKGFDPQKGSATISQNQRETLIKSGERAIIHWDQFSIDPNELVHFQQMNAKSRVLNRVMGKDSSKLLGKLSSNGQVFLINPQGIYIGPAGRIETSGFVGSTLNLLDGDFWEGKNLFFHDPGKGTIQNLGTISCPSGDIVLISRAITSEGTLHAPSGHVGLGAGVEILLRPNGDERISILTDLILPNGKEETAVETVGEIEALTIELKASKNPYEKAIHCAGTVNALSKKEEGGRIFLVASKGNVIVDSALTAKSGTVHVLGEGVHLTENTSIDVSGQEGGTVLIGGDYQGKTPSIMNARSTSVAKNATIHADGLEGDGGKVIIWSDHNTQYQGYISAQATGNQGNGGFVEVSSPGVWRYEGEVDTKAANGKTGILLFDPSDITVNGVATSNPPFDPPPVYNPAGVAAANLLNTDLSTALGSNNIIIATSAGVGGNGDVTFILGPTWGAATTLTVSADRSIVVNAGAHIDGSNGGAAGQGSISLNSGLSVAGSSYTGIQVLGQLTTDSGSITLNGVGGDQAATNHSVDIAAGAAITTNGAISINGDRNVLIQDAATTVTANGTGTINIQGQGNFVAATNDFNGIRVQAATVSVDNGSLTMTGNGGEASFNRGVLVNTDGMVTATGTGTITITGTADLLGGVNPQNKEGFSVGTQAPNKKGTVQVNNGTLTISGTGGNGFLSQGAEVNFEGRIRSIGSGDISITGFGGSTMSSFSTGFVFASDSVIEATGTGNIFITGFGEGTGDRSVGVKRFPDAGASGRIESQSGNINILGVGSPDGGTLCHGLSLEGGPSTGVIRSNAGGNITIQATGGGNSSSNGVFLDKGLITTPNGGNISITATGGGGNSSNGVQLTGFNGNTVISTTSVLQGGDITINATGGPSGTNNNGVSVEVGADIRSSSGSITIDGTGGPNGGGSYGVSVTGTGSLIQTGGTGNLSVTGRAGGSNIEGMFISQGGVIRQSGTGSALVQTFSDLVMSNGSAISSLTSPLTVRVARDINMSNGASIGSSGSAMVTAGRDVLMTGAASATAFITASDDLTLIAGRNLIMNASFDLATLVGSANNLTIVVDNAFPSSPGIGPGFISKDTFSQILTFGGTVRIFTARQPLNTIQGEINSAPFVPGIQFVDTTQEQWGTYFPSSFGGTPFTIFYKDSIQDTVTMLINQLQIANEQLSDAVPFFPYVRIPFEFNYVGELCNYDPTNSILRCRPNFAPYGSFIFEDQVFWIGERWDESSHEALLEYLKQQYGSRSSSR